MGTAHTAIAMSMEGDKVLLFTVLDRAMLPIPVDIVMMAVNTASGIYSNNLPQMTFRTDEMLDATKRLRGMGAAGILRSPVWSIKKTNGMFESTPDQPENVEVNVVGSFNGNGYW